MTVVAETERLSLRQWRTEEYETLRALLSHPETMKHWPAIPCDDYIRDWFDWAQELYADRGYGRWAVFRKSDGAVIGDCGLVPIEIEGAPVTDLGYIIHADHHRQGYGSEAAHAALALGRDRFGLTDIVCHMAEDHTASQRVAEAIGLTRSGGFSNPRNLGKWHLIYRPKGE